MTTLDRNFPPEFIERYSRFIPDFDAFLAAMRTPLKRTFRVNRLKATPDRVLELMADLAPEPLTWYSDGFSIPSRGSGVDCGAPSAGDCPRAISLGKRLEHFLGLIYVQEAASMAPPLVLNPQPGERVLDIAAAPGSKTTQMSAMMNNTGIIIANDPSPTRVRALIGNVDRAGCLNVAVCRMDGLGLGRSLTGTCDRVLVDAPCSAEGTIRKTAAMLETWSVDAIEKYPSVQKRLVSIGFQSLKPGGVMVYSTCTVAPEENEAVVAWLLQRHPEAELLDIGLPGLVMRSGLDGWQGVEFPPSVQKCRRILPQDNDTEPFFLALVRRPG